MLDSIYPMTFKNIFVIAFLVKKRQDFALYHFFATSLIN